MVELTERFLRAVQFASEAHKDDLRKGTEIPYISHLLQVAGLVLEFGGTENEVIGGLLHDAAEDSGGEETLLKIKSEFGAEVEAIVRENSDSLSPDKDNKAPWLERKTLYLQAIEHKSIPALLVSICDKIHNARSLNQDSRTLGDSHWKRFNATKDESLWYYRSLVTEFERRISDDVRLKVALATLKLEVDQL